MKLKKIICLLLAVTIITLTGCGATKEASSEKVKKIKQEEMSEEEMAKVLRQIEYSAIDAALLSDAYLSQWYHCAYIGDTNGDSVDEFVYGVPEAYLLFSAGESRELHVSLGQGGQFFTDKTGVLYSTDDVSAPLYNGSKEIGWSYCNRYSYWDGSEFVTSHRVYTEEPYNGTAQTHYLVGEAEESITEKEFNEIGYTPYTKSSKEFTNLSFDAQYCDHVTESLKNYLSERYPECTSAQKDVDGDGVEETIIAIPDILSPWTQFLASDNSAWSDTSGIIESIVTDIESGHSTLLVISTKEETTTVNAYGMSENIYYDASDIEFHDNYFILGGYTVYIPGKNINLSSLSDIDRNAVLTSLNNNFISRGYRDMIFKVADVSDLPGEEIFCFVNEDGILYQYIISIANGEIKIITKDNIDTNSYYLVDYNGKTHILSYQQYTTSGNELTYSYYYSLYRYDAEGYSVVADENSISYTSSQSNATAVSAFFTALNVHLEKDIIVLHDSYALTGNEWMDSEQIDFGAAPSTPADKPEQEGKLGFVKVYEDTWLNLRTGPGTQYDRVLLDPNNPQSFVKQALGSPVTILEEIETGDKDNPVWVKIRITYANRELIGYSSKRYIKVVGE